MPFSLSICIFSQELAQLVEPLKSDYSVLQVYSVSELTESLEKGEPIDCLVVGDRSSDFLKQLVEQDVLLPVAIVSGSDRQPPLDLAKQLHSDTAASERTSGTCVRPLEAPSESALNSPKSSSDTAPSASSYLYHRGEVRLFAAQVEELPAYIEQAIARFLQLGASCPLHSNAKGHLPTALLLQQHRLAQNLQGKLGQLAACHSRNPQNFYRNLPQPAQQKLFDQLNSQYCQIVLAYFSEDSKANYLIDGFANQAFIADVSASQVIEMHMELMDEFSQQLKLQGRSEEILLDYRLTLIDVIAHLSEMYRRSVPISLEGLVSHQ